jgi:hypothetical protein
MQYFYQTIGGTKCQQSEEVAEGLDRDGLLGATLPMCVILQGSTDNDLLPPLSMLPFF